MFGDDICKAEEELDRARELVERDTEVPRWGEKPGPWGRSGKGKVEVWSSASKYPPSTHYRYLPSVGTVVIRLTRKDGNPNNRFETEFSRGSVMRWLPEGVDPNVTNKTAATVVQWLG